MNRTCEQAAEQHRDASKRMHVPLLDLHAQYRSIQTEMESAVLDVLRSQQFILGPKVESCEKEIAQYCQSAFAVGASSGTDAVLLALMAESIGPGDEVITSPFTFFATVGAIVRLGATPVFVDIDEKSFNIEPGSIERRLTPRTKAIIPVHLFGQCADMDAILEVAKARNLIVIEDAAQAIGAEYRGRRAGSMGHYGCLSFFPSKNLGCAGDGGMVVTQDRERAERMKLLRAHGAKPKYFHKFVGGNFRLDAIQAAVVSVKLPYLDEWSSARRANAEKYREMFSATELIQSQAVALPLELDERTHIYNQFVIRAQRRDELLRHLHEHDIGAEIYYPCAMHLQECFSSLGHKHGDFPESEKAAAESLALPIYPELSAEQQQYVVKTISRFYQ